VRAVETSVAVRQTLQSDSPTKRSAFPLTHVYPRVFVLSRFRRVREGQHGQWGTCRTREVVRATERARSLRRNKIYPV